MAVTVTIYPKIITWNSLTWDNTNGGPLAIRYMHTGRAITDRTGDSEYPTFTAIVDKELRITVSLRELKEVLVRGTKSDMVATVETKGGATSTITFAGMVLEAGTGSQDRAVPGGTELTFVHENVSGANYPVS